LHDCIARPAKSAFQPRDTFALDFIARSRRQWLRRLLNAAWQGNDRGNLHVQGGVPCA